MIQLLYNKFLIYLNFGFNVGFGGSKEMFEIGKKIYLLTVVTKIKVT